MPVRMPSTEQLLDIAEFFGMTLDTRDAESFRSLMAGSIASYNRLDEPAGTEAPCKISANTWVPTGPRRESPQRVVLEGRHCRLCERDSWPKKGGS